MKKTTEWKAWEKSFKKLFTALLEGKQQAGFTLERCRDNIVTSQKRLRILEAETTESEKGSPELDKFTTSEIIFFKEDIKAFQQLSLALENRIAAHDELLDHLENLVTPHE